MTVKSAVVGIPTGAEFWRIGPVYEVIVGVLWYVMEPTTNSQFPLLAPL
jgi:hypothetical protein